MRTRAAIGKDLKSYLNRPQLIVDNIRPENFRFLTDENNARFLLARIKNVGGRRAENCLAHVIIDDEKEFKLHWCDESWKFRRDSAPKIDLEPTESRDLDVAFAIIPKTKTSTYTTTQSGDSPTSVTLPPYSNPTSSSRKFVPSDSNNLKPQQFDLEGAFVATPAAPSNLSSSASTFLSPGEHLLEIRLIVSGAQGFAMKFIIISGKEAFQLNVIDDSIQFIE